MPEVNQQDPFARDSGRDRGPQSAPRMHGADRGHARREGAQGTVDHSDTVAEACVRHPWPNDPGPVVEGASSGRAAPDADPSTPTDSGARTSRDADAGRPAHRDADGAGVRRECVRPEPVTLVMTRRMLHRIRQRAERSSDAQSASGQRAVLRDGRLGASPSPSRVSVVERGGRRLHHVDSTQTTDQVLGCRPRSFDGASHAGAGSRPKGVPPGMLLSTQGTAPM
jgi:hypothetical protein